MNRYKVLHEGHISDGMTNVSKEDFKESLLDGAKIIEWEESV